MVKLQGSATGFRPGERCPHDGARNSEGAGAIRWRKRGLRECIFESACRHDDL